MLSAAHAYMPGLQRVEWMNTTCNHALFALLEIFNMFYGDLKDIVLEDLLDRIHWCTLQGIFGACGMRATTRTYLCPT